MIVHGSPELSWELLGSHNKKVLEMESDTDLQFENAWTRVLEALRGPGPEGRATGPP